MSTEYCFVSTDRKKQVADLKAILERERDALLERLAAFGATHPLVKEDIDDFTFSLRQCVNSAALQATDDDEHTIGVSTSAKFHWNTSSGFCKVEDVERFLAENPDFVIEDEYGSLVSLENFKAVLGDISDRG